MTRHEGGCLCGTVRYRIDAALGEGAYCHCRMCQRASGAPVLAFAGAPTVAFTWTRSVPRVHRSSARSERLFCPECGCQVAMRALDTPEQIDICIATLDDPGAVQPAYHIWTASRLPWFETADDLPRHPGEQPGSG